MIIDKIVNLAQLQAEMGAAGVAATALGQTGPELFTYDKSGVPCELPEGAAAVVAAHVPAVPPDPDTELEAAITAATTLAQLRDALLGKTRAGKVQGQPR